MKMDISSIPLFLHIIFSFFVHINIDFCPNSSLNTYRNWFVFHPGDWNWGICATVHFRTKALCHTAWRVKTWQVQAASDRGLFPASTLSTAHSSPNSCLLILGAEKEKPRCPLKTAIKQWHVKQRQNPKQLAEKTHSHCLLSSISPWECFSPIDTPDSSQVELNVHTLHLTFM